ncbi:hypothetical protein E6A33_25515 [Escherichia coli]|nr:hypothetical protein [Escherichia coli]
MKTTAQGVGPDCKAKDVNRRVRITITHYSKSCKITAISSFLHWYSLSNSQCGQCSISKAWVIWAGSPGECPCS